MTNLSSIRKIHVRGGCKARPYAAEIERVAFGEFAAADAGIRCARCASKFAKQLARYKATVVEIEPVAETLDETIARDRARIAEIRAIRAANA
jgi:hypothetical protein